MDRLRKNASRAARRLVPSIGPDLGHRQGARRIGERHARSKCRPPDAIAVTKAAQKRVACAGGIEHLDLMRREAQRARPPGSALPSRARPFSARHSPCLCANSLARHPRTARPETERGRSSSLGRKIDDIARASRDEAKIAGIACKLFAHVRVERDPEALRPHRLAQADHFRAHAWVAKRGAGNMHIVRLEGGERLTPPRDRRRIAPPRTARCCRQNRGCRRRCS